MDSKKSNKITEIVRLQQILKKWRKIANSSKNSSKSNNVNNSSSNESTKFLKKTVSLSNNSMGTGTGFSSNIVPKGYVAVCVGEELKRFVIPMEHLGHPAFGILLREAEKEFGFQQEGVLRIPCEVCVFEKILKVIEERKQVFFTQEFRISGEDTLGCYKSENQLSQPLHPQSPMCM